MKGSPREQGPEPQATADVGNFDEAKPGAVEQTSEGGDGAPEADDEQDGSVASAPVHQSQPRVRRSSLRPAPADYRPSVRDPSTLRPIAVVRAGDAVPVTPATAQGQPNDATFEGLGAAAYEFGAVRTDDVVDRITPLEIPPPPAFPIDLVPRNRLTPEPETEPADAVPAAQAEPEPQPSTVVSVPRSKRADESVRSAANGTARRVDVEAAPAGSVSVRALSQARRRSPVAIAVAGFVIAGALAAMVRGRERSASPQPAPPRTAPPDVSLQPSSPPVAAASAKVPSGSGERVQPVAEPSAVASALASAVPSARPDTAPLADPDTTHVALELTPIDAKVILRGREVTGPPFEFDVEKGERLALEVKRSGFVTAKVVLDGKKPIVHFGMLRERSTAHRSAPREK